MTKKFGNNKKMTETQEDVIFETLSSTNQRLMREMEEFLSSVDKSDVLPAPVQTLAEGPQPQSTSSSVNPRQQRHDCGVIFERSTEDCDNKTGINEAQSSEDYDDFDMKLQNIDNTIDKALHNLQTQSKSEGGRKPAEYEYYNDPKYQRQTRDHSLDDDSLVAMARRLDDASIISDPSVICGTREKFPLIANQRYNRKSAKLLPEKTTSGNRGERLAHSRRNSNTSSASSKLPRDEGGNSNNSARYKTEEDVLKSTPAVEKETAARMFDKNNSQPSIPRSYFKDDDNRTYKNSSVNHIRKENYIQPMPSSSSEYRKKSSEQVDLKSRRKRDSAPADSRYAQTIPPRASYSDFRSGSTTINSSHDSDTDDGEGSDHTEFFYESTDDGSECDDEYDPRAVGSSVADAVKDLNNQRGLKRVMNLFGKKSKGEEDMWSVSTQR